MGGTQTLLNFFKNFLLFPSFLKAISCPLHQYHVFISKVIVLGACQSLLCPVPSFCLPRWRMAGWGPFTGVWVLHFSHHHYKCIVGMLFVFFLEIKLMCTYTKTFGFALIYSCAGRQVGEVGFQVRSMTTRDSSTRLQSSLSMYSKDLKCYNEGIRFFWIMYVLHANCWGFLNDVIKLYRTYWELSKPHRPATKLAFCKPLSTQSPFL